MKRRQFVSALAAGLALRHSRASAQPAELGDQLRDVWSAWRDAHANGSGRVIDAPQQFASHSEGQSYGLFLAALAGDRRTFDRIETWTRVNLAIRSDALMAWRWLPDSPVRVPDTNNASDGDLFRAWALLRASDRFLVPEYRELAATIAADLAEHCIAERSDGTPLLLPAADGFRTAEGFIVNLAYSMPLALEELAAAFGLPVLAQAAEGAVRLSAELAEGGVVPDWVEVTESGLIQPEGFSFDCGYEAMRVPLFYIWSGLADHPAVRTFALAQRAAPENRAATIIERGSGAILETSSEAGYRSLSALSACVTENSLGSGMLPFSVEQAYYPATLQVFSMIAQAQGAPRCIPL
ncbi:glycosyl hydrolase family 5 [Roseivivax halodurans JCM 10272]|uniref:cellulase n=1 Tax=Roseivivax halodurans JCM 10272 TaxID=1449350 RepID=X7EDT5_9RHOB|nr:glycosyl hydrolase family 8 [Roseivivax halodurans]ETX14097.1 glycosyl hydrolase family 5 [Roseivivax halodurans JCM 10272]